MISNTGLPAEASRSDVPLEELLGRRDDSTLALVDVLPRESYESGHIPGAIALPLAEIPARAASVLPDRDQDIIVYCGGPT